MGLVIELVYASDNEDVVLKKRGHPHDGERPGTDGATVRIEIKSSCPLKLGRVKDVLNGLPLGVEGNGVLAALAAALASAVSFGSADKKFTLLFEVS